MKRVGNLSIDATVQAANGPYRMTPDFVPGVVLFMDSVLIGLSGLVTGEFLANEMASVYENVLTVLAFFIFFYLMAAQSGKIFSIGAVMKPLRRIEDIVLAVCSAGLFVLSILFAFDAWAQIPIDWVLYTAGIAIPAIVLFRVAACRILRTLARRGVIGSNIAVLGVGEQSRRYLSAHAKAQPFFQRVIGVFDPEASGALTVEGQPVLGGIDDLLIYARRRRLDDVVVAMPWSADRKAIEVIEALKELPINVYLCSDLLGFDLRFEPVSGNFRQLPVFEVVQRPISGWNSLLKTLEDYAIALVLLIVLAPLMLLVALAIKIDSPGPVFFLQRRLGFNNQEFAIYKFRSMYHRDAPEAVVKQASRSDPRVTRVGRFIRATSLDELPQLLNVLNGTMSLVGPRPHAVSHNVEYGARIRGYFARHKVKPGITGWAQVNGLRGETSELDQMEKRIRHDVYYAENWSLFLDIRILVMTALLVFFQKNAY